MAALTGSVNPDSLEPLRIVGLPFDGESQGSSPLDDWHGYHLPRPGDLSTPPNRFTHDPPRGIATSASFRRLRCQRMPQNAPRPCPDIPASDCLETPAAGLYSALRPTVRRPSRGTSRVMPTRHGRWRVNRLDMSVLVCSPRKSDRADYRRRCNGARQGTGVSR